MVFQKNKTIKGKIEKQYSITKVKRFEEKKSNNLLIHNDFFHKPQ